MTERYQDLEAVPEVAETDIAIIGMAGKFPEAQTIAEYWDNLKAGKECIKFFTTEELQDAGVPPYLLNQPNYVKATGVLEGADLFDADFFGFSPKEAQIIDPQHRLFLEQAWTALEHGGYSPQSYPGAIGVYAGVGLNSYLLQSLYPNLLSNVNLDSYQIQIRNDKDFLPTLVAYKLNLRGPSLTIQTACSTSLVATHLACQGLLNGECDMALAGGVTVYVNPTGYLYTEGMILSPDGHCRAFDAKAQGTVGGNGVGVVVLKRLADAIADHDTIYATIKGSAINNDGSAKVGYTAPSVAGQTAVIAEAQAIANTPAETISYVETHGTGTILGDPIEIAALTQAFRQSTDKVQFCALGSVKTNIGHLDTAAGVASLIKVALALHYKTIPPSLNFDTPNPAIPFSQSPFFVNTALTDWPQTPIPRRAGVSSFGIGGTNAHLVLEEAPTIPLAVSPPMRPWQMLILSAKSDAALTQQQQNLVAHLRQHPEVSLADVAFTLAVGRQAFAHRRVCLVQTVADAMVTLEHSNADEVFVVKADHSPVVFLFPGQGTQTHNMGRDLYEQETVFRNALDQCAQLLQPHLGEDIRELLYSTCDRPNRLDQTQWAQPILFAVEYALAQLWLYWGIEPEAMVGHSLGEYVAACLAGVFSLEDALKLIAHRARLMQQLPPGAMLAISASEAEVAQWLSDEISLAASNGAVCTVSGSVPAIAQLEIQLTAAGQSATRLNTSHAFHCPLVEPMLADFRQVLNAVRFNPPQRDYFSNVTGTWMTPTTAVDPEYWMQHLRYTVRFGEAISQLLTEPNWICLEVGPGRTLTGLVRRHAHYQGQTLLNSLPLAPNIPENQALLSTLGRLWLRGVPCQWKRYYRGETRQRIPLPTYPFERQRYWMDPPKESGMSSFGLSRNPDPSQWFYTPSWKQLPSLPLKTLPSGQCWLIFLDEMGFGIALAEQLTGAGQTVMTVGLKGNRWRSPKAHFTVRADDPQAYFNLLFHLKTQGQFPQHILHLWSFTKATKVDFRAESVLDQTHRGLYTLLSLVQAIGKLGHFDPTQIHIITNGSYSILGTEALNPIKSTLLGALKVIPQEYPQISCRLIDLENAPPKELNQLDWIQTLLVDLVTPDAPLEIAYRGRSRWTPCYEPMVLEEPDRKHQRLRTQGVYLITGGLGGIGLTLASYLAKSVQARLILVTRSAFPDRRTWTNWCLTHDESDPIRSKIQQLLTLESYGAKVWVGQADVTDLPRLQSLLAEAEAEMGCVQGVIHCAGVADFGGIIQGRQPRDTEKILAAKVTGTLVLDHLFRDRPLDFWILSSSLSTVLYKTLFGQVGYGAANEFLSAFCAYKQKTTQTLAISIHWTEWDAVGMAVDSRAERLKNKARTEEDRWLIALTPEEGADAFSRILNQAQSQVIVCPQQLSLLLQQQAQWDSNQLLESLEIDLDSNQPKAPRPSLAIPYTAPQTQLEALLATQWEAYLGIAPIGLNDSFYELGGDSLLAIGLLSQLQKKLSVNLPITVLLETPTIAGLATYLSTLDNAAITPLLASCTPEAKPSAPAASSRQDTPSPPIPIPPAQLLNLAAEPQPAMSSFSDSSKQSVNLLGEASASQLPQPAAPLVPSLPSPLIANYHKGILHASPLFFIHPIGGGISCYAPLSRRLNPDWPFYSIRALGLENTSSPIDNIQTMARCYIQAIQNIQPQGPYFLGGWSMGGIVAYEMARQLIQQQHAVGGLILIDSPTPSSHERNAVEDFTTFAKGLGFFPEHIQRFRQTLRHCPTVPPTLLAQLLDEGQRIGVLTRGFDAEALQQLYTVFAAHSKALSTYTAEPMATPIPSLYLEAQSIDNSLLGLFGEQARTRWQQCLGRTLMIRSLPGDHYTLVTEPHVVGLSTYINAFLGQIKNHSIHSIDSEISTIHSQALSTETAEPTATPMPSLNLNTQSIDNSLLGVFGEQARTQWQQRLEGTAGIRSLSGDHTPVTESHASGLSTYINALGGQMKNRSIVSESSTMSAEPVKSLFPMSWLILGLMTAAISLPIAGIQRLAHAPITEPEVETKPVAKSPVRVAALGRIEPTSGVIQVGGPINEILGKLLIKEGDLVTKGQIIGYLRSYDERRSELNTAQQLLQTARARLVTNTQFSEAQEKERTIDSAKVPLVQNSGIAAQQAQIDTLQSQRSLALKELTRYQFLVDEGAAPRNEIDQRQSQVEQLDQRIRQAQETLAQLINSRDRELANVKAQINTARINTARIQTENDVASAKQAIELAQVKLDNAIIRSPIGGRILRILTKAGESIGDQGQGKGSLVEVADTTAMQVVAEVSESDIRLVKPGQMAKIVSRNKAFEGTLTGRVTELGRQIFKNNVLNDDPSAFSDARVIQVKVAIDDSEAVAKFTNLQVDVQIDVKDSQISPPS